MKNIKDCIPYGSTLYPYQEETVLRTLKFFATTESGACYVANDPGLGKSVTSCVTVNMLGASKVLIVVPAVMKLVWEQEIYSWCRLTCTSVPRVCVLDSASDVIGVAAAQFVIVSYSLVINPEVLKVLVQQDYDLLICDEAHAIKSKKSKRSRAVIKDLWPKCKHKILLSGTPMTRNVVDCWVPFHNILPSKFPSFDDFAARYSYMRVTKWAVDYYGLKNAEELSKIIRDNFFIRYKKEDVLPQLPSKQWQRITLPPSYSVKVQARDAEKIRKEQQYVLDAVTSDKQIVIPASMAEHRRLQGEAKVPAVVEFVRDLLEQEIPVVVFGYHKSVLGAIKEQLAEFEPVVITGETSNEERMEAITSFQTGATSLFIGNIIAAGSGITLTRSSTVVFAELDWVPATIAQASDRVHRIGQKSQVTIHYFVVANSIDSTIEELIINRARDFKKLLDEPTKENM